MAEITAAMVRELRDRTGVAMMDCKSALAETGGDMDKAVDLLRKKGQAKQDKLASREAREGRVAVAVASDTQSGVLVEINCNTDFTAKSAPVEQVSQAAVQFLLANPNAAVAEDPAVKAKITEAAQVTGENVRIGRTQALSNPAGKVGSYSHYTGKVGVLVALNGNPSDELIKDLCLHITAARPLALNRESVPADVVAKERDIAVEQAKATGKPQAIAEKIAEGKMRVFYEERVLLDQKFVKDDSKSITQLLQEGNCTLVNYARIEIGQ
jgi:elongation factor Ts